MKDWLKFISFIVVLSIVLLGLDIFVFTGEMKNSRYSQFFNEEENSLDVVFIGNSTVRQGIIPAEIWNDHKITSFNISHSPTHPEVIVLAIDEIARLQNPKLVFIDITGLTYQKEADQESFVKQFVGSMPHSKHKEEIIKKYSYFDGENEIFRNHNDYRNPDYWDLFSKQNKYLKGFTPVYDVADLYPSTIVKDDTIIELPFDGQKYLKRILDTCAKYPEIDFLFGRMPRVLNEGSVKETYMLRSVVPIINEYGYEWVEFEDYIKEIGLISNEDFADSGHLNYNGAIKFTKFLIPFLKDNYDLENQEHAEKVVQKFNQAYKNYNKKVKSKYLNQ